MQQTVKAVVHKGETHYVAECLEVAVVTQGKTLDETIKNLQEAVELHLEELDELIYVLENIRKARNEAKHYPQHQKYTVA